jgi:SAM-dependent methyltransferase
MLPESRQKPSASAQSEPTAIAQWVADFATASPPGRILDVGCGTRPYEGLFASWDYVGIDVEESGRAGELKHVDRYFDGRSIPFEDGSFDAVMCTEVLEHCVDPVALTAEMHRVLRPGGGAVITVPFMWGEHEIPYDFRRYSINGISQLLEAAGFVVEQSVRSQPGVDALAALAASEINNALQTGSSSGAASLRARALRKIEPYLWAVLRRTWRSQYVFARIYIDNLIVARRPESR